LGAINFPLNAPPLFFRQFLSILSPQKKPTNLLVHAPLGPYFESLFSPLLFLRVSLSSPAAIDSFPLYLRYSPKVFFFSGLFLSFQNAFFFFSLSFFRPAAFFFSYRAQPFSAGSSGYKLKKTLPAFALGGSLLKAISLPCRLLSNPHIIFFLTLQFVFEDVFPPPPRAYHPFFRGTLPPH